MYQDPLKTLKYYRGSSRKNRSSQISTNGDENSLVGGKRNVKTIQRIGSLYEDSNSYLLTYRSGEHRRSGWTWRSGTGSCWVCETDLTRYCMSYVNDIR